MRAVPRGRPCASCPYRRDVPSGIWDASEYAKLPLYDGDASEQVPAVFMCHQDDGLVCSGWLGHRDPAELLAVRFGVLHLLDPQCLDYTTDVPLFATGAEAAEHGLAELEDPGPGARGAVAKIKRKRELEW